MFNSWMNPRGRRTPDPMQEIFRTPWTEAQVQGLNVYQVSGRFHPYTCPKCTATLTATPQGWTCDCGYRQNWAYAWTVTTPAAWLGLGPKVGSDGG